MPGLQSLSRTCFIFLLLSHAISIFQACEDIPLKISAADLAFTRGTAALLIVIITISVNQTAKSKFIHLTRPTELNEATCVGRQYFMSSVATKKSEVLPFALIRLYYILSLNALSDP